MPHTYMRAVAPGAAGRSEPVAVSNNRRVRPDPGSRGSGGAGQERTLTNLSSGRRDFADQRHSALDVETSSGSSTTSTLRRAARIDSGQDGWETHDHAGSDRLPSTTTPSKTATAGLT